MKNKAVWVGGITGAIIGGIFLAYLLLINGSLSLFSGQIFILGLMPFAFWIFFGGYIGYNIEKRFYKPLLVFLILFIIVLGVNLSYPLGEYTSPGSVFKEKVTIRFDSVSPEKIYVNYSDPRLDDTAIWRSDYNITVVKDGHADGVGDTRHPLSNGTKLTLTKKNGDLEKIYENSIGIGIDPQLAQNYIEKNHGSDAVPELGKTYEVILFSPNGKEFYFEHYVNPSGLTPAQEYGKKTAISITFYSMIILSTPIYIFTMGFFLLYLFIITSYGLGLIAIAPGLIIARWATKNMEGGIKKVDYWMIFLQYLVLLIVVVSSLGILPTW